MGYSTSFKGVLKIVPEVTIEQIRELNKILGDDVREHEDWGINPDKCGFYFIDLEVTTGLDGLRWSGAEKSYGMVEQVNFVIDYMRKKWPTFWLSGSLEAQGEESDDAWTLVIVDGRAVKQPRELPGVKTTCPECEHRFRVMPDGKVAE